MTTYFLSIIFAGIILLIAAIISLAIKYNSDQSDVKNRKAWFWIWAILNPAFFYLIAAFVMAPSDRRGFEEWMDSLPIATIVGFAVYIVLGFVLSKVFKNGKIGNWF
jgi:uncharacterized membrane protein